MIRTTYIILWVVLTTIFWGLTAIITSFFTHTGNPVHIVARMWAQSIMFASRIKVTVNGLANIDPTQSYVYMSNHQSNFDIPVLLAYLPVQFRWLAKAELFKIPIFGRAMRGAGYIKIDRYNQESAFESINEAARKMKNGVSAMALNAGVPIVPIVLKGTWTIMDKSSLRINTGEVSLNILAPIATTGYTRETKDDLIKSVRAVIREGFEKG